MNNSFARTIAIAKAQIRICWSLVRFWVAFALLNLVALVGYIQSCVWKTLSTAYSPSYSLTEPKYLLSNVDALVILAFQLVAVLLTYDIRENHRKNRILLALESRQLTNFEYLTGSVLGVTFLLYGTIFCSVALIVGIGAIGYFTSAPWSDFLDPTSVFNLLVVDAIPSLFLWCSIALALTCILRSSLVAALVSVFLITTLYILSLLVPFSWLDVVTPSSNFTAYLSDLVPNFATLETIGMRAVTVLGALGLLAVAACVLGRRDARIGILNLPLGVGLMSLSIVGFFLLSHQLLQAYYQPVEWSKIHANHEKNVSLDIDEIRGSVNIDPGNLLELDLKYAFRLTHDDKVTELTFTLNSGLNVGQVILNGKVVEHEFENGLLTVLADVPLRRDVQQTMGIRALGIPDPKFAYLDSPTDYLNDRTIPRRAAQLFGKDGSIFTSKYVALMPGMYWYPVPESQSLERSLKYGIDFFHTNIDLSVTNPNWILVGTDIVQVGDDATKYKLQPTIPLSELAVFGTKFVKHSITIANIKFNLYLHEKHLKNISRFDMDDERVREEIEDIFVPFEEAGLGYPFEELSFVEVPNRLRTLSGGFKPESVQVLPGMVLMKERGFPLAHFDTRIKRIERWEDDPENMERRKYWALVDYFGDAVGTDNVWTNFSKIFWTHSTSAAGKDATALNDLVLNVISRLSPAPDLWFSPYATYQISDFTHIFLPAVEWVIDEGSGGELTNWARNLSQEYLRRHAVWEAMETKSLLNLPTSDSHQSDFEFMLTKNRLIARVMVQSNKREAIFSWLSNLRNGYTGKSYTQKELLEHAEAAEVEIHPYLDVWLSDAELPGYVVSELTHRRLSNAEDGTTRYETSFYVHNPSDTTGVFWTAYPDQYDREWPRTPTVVVEAQSTVRINIVTSYGFNYVHVYPNLSLNRGEFGIRSAQTVIWEDLQEDGEPRPSLEVVDWRPPERGIVVDDLDSGFSVEQPAAFNNASSIGPLGWFRIPRLQADNDNGLPSRRNYAYRTRSGVWGRISDDRSYGHFRRTATVTRFSPEIHPVMFSTKLPDTTRWKLEYFFNTTWFRRSSRDGIYHLEIEHAEATETSTLSFENSIYGWNFVGEFELLKGDVNVRVVSATNDTSWLYADAIRWMPVTIDQNREFKGGGGGGS